jgi:hypothetical protein
MIPWKREREREREEEQVKMLTTCWLASENCMLVTCYNTRKENLKSMGRKRKKRSLFKSVKYIRK